MNDCNSYDDFDHIFLCQLDKYVPPKKQWIRGNTKPHLNNKLGTAIVTRSRLKNKTNKAKYCYGIINYKSQRNLEVKSNKESKFESFNIYDPNKEAKLFWVNCKPYFSNKDSKVDTNIILHESSKLFTKNQNITNIFNYYFGSVVEKVTLFQ